MGPLDLTKRPPRSASVAVDDIAYFPRIIDKIRAVEAVKAATDDVSVADWLHKRVGDAAISKWNIEFRGTSLRELKNLLGDRLFTVYPIARELPDDTSLAQLLDADDLLFFPDHELR